MPKRFWERFFAKVSPEPNSGCWLWTGSASGRPTMRYGQVRVGGHLKQAHRVIYETEVGPIPIGFEVDHLCRNTYCVNPRHLEAVTPLVNVLRAAAANAQRPTCFAGHRRDLNTYVASNGKRCCRVCMSIWTAKSRAAHAKSPSRRHWAINVLRQHGIEFPVDPPVQAPVGSAAR